MGSFGKMVWLIKNKLAAQVYIMWKSGTFFFIIICHHLTLISGYCSPQSSYFKGNFAALISYYMQPGLHKLPPDMLSKRLNPFSLSSSSQWFWHISFKIKTPPKCRSCHWNFLLLVESFKNQFSLATYLPFPVPDLHSKFPLFQAAFPPLWFPLLLLFSECSWVL